MAFYDKILDSDDLAPYFENIDMRSLIDHQTKFVSSVMGGPASYSNAALRQLHAHLSIDRDAFDEVLTLFEETLEDFDMAQDDIELIVADIKSRAHYIVSK
jgi:hemoglobin